MHPELFQIPFLHLTIKSYGLMMVVGFLAAVTVIRYLSRPFTANPIHITNAALYSLIAGIAGARAFFVVHYFDTFRDAPLSVFAIWNGGLELVGGVLLAIVVIVFYIWYHKLPMRHYLDVLAVGLMAALVFGRVGCFLNGCCYGRPAELPWAVQFPYGSFSYRSQVRPDLERNRLQPYVPLPEEYFGYTDEQGVHMDLKPWKYLTPQQKELVTTGPYHALAVHPTQLYSSASAVLLGLILYGLWRRSQRAERVGRYPFLTKPGSVFALVFILYGIMRFIMESIRDDNPFEMAGLTISQLLCLPLIVLGMALVVFYAVSQPEPVPASVSKSRIAGGSARQPS
jgi:phosphatidylglycerol:prolipoprotein diacylglycerol transferase